MIWGVGCDLVEVTDFAAQLKQPGTQFAEVFTGREIRQAQGRAQATGLPVAWHLAGRWAVKESVLKAWSVSLFGQPPVISQEEFNFKDIEVTFDKWGRPQVLIGGKMARCLSGDYRFHTSISHDGNYAQAYTIFEASPETGLASPDSLLDTAEPQITDFRLRPKTP